MFSNRGNDVIFLASVYSTDTGYKRCLFILVLNFLFSFACNLFYCKVFCFYFDINCIKTYTPSLHVQKEVVFLEGRPFPANHTYLKSFQKVLIG